MMAKEKKYSAVLIGSSGGGTATLGHTNPVEFLETVHKVLCRLRSDEKGTRCVGLSHAIFVSLCDGSGFDSIQKDNWHPGNKCSLEHEGPLAKLYSVGFHNNIDLDTQDQEAREHLNVHTITGPLPEINAKAKQLDEKLSKILHKNNALISVSSEPTIIHTESLRSCSTLSIPVTGSGGTSISKIAELYNLPIIGAQGSVASTTLTKARGWAMGLAKEWGMKYDYNVDDTSDNNVQGEATRGEATPIPSLKSILESTLPSSLFVCIFLRFVGFGSANDTTMKIEYCLRYYVPGISCSILAATSRNSSSTHRSSQDLSTTLLASALAGVLSSASSQLDDIHEGGSALAGLFAGSLIPHALSIVSNLCVKHNITATMTNLVCGGGVGMIVGMIMYWSSAAYILSVFTGWVRCLIRWKQISTPDTNFLVKTFARALMKIQLAWVDCASSASMAKFIHTTTDVPSNEFLPIPRGLGFLIGCIFVYGSKIGWYHSIFLPLIMLEMDSSTREEAASLLGAIDECTLVMVCAGICSGNLISSRRLGGNKSLSWQALKTNILCGDFIEACYPSMEKSRLVNAFAYLAAGISSEIIVRQRMLSSAYMPLPISILISNDRWGMIAASSVSFGISFIGTLLANQINSVTIDGKKRN